MKVIIAGSRNLELDLEDIAFFITASDLTITELVNGCCPTGVDAAAANWARANAIPQKDFPADWTKFGRRAGPLRNKEMAEYADALIAISKNPITPGTQNMVDNMTRLKKPVYFVVEGN